MRLAQHHISRAEYGYASDRRSQDSLGLLDIEQNPVPARLSLDVQGVFVLGYYPHRAALTLLFWKWLPQEMPVAAIPLVVLVVIKGMWRHYWKVDSWRDEFTGAWRRKES